MATAREIAVDQIIDLWCSGIGGIEKRPKHHAPSDGTIENRATKIVDDLLAAFAVKEEG